MQNNKQLTTISFLTCVREAIDLSISTMEGLDESTKSSLSEFILSEASDYEVLHFIYTSKFPKEKYNAVNESAIIEDIKIELMSNSAELIETGLFTEQLVDELSESLVPLSEYGLTSSRTILEHLSSTGILKSILEEGWKDKLNLNKTFGKGAFKGTSKKELKDVAKRVKGKVVGYDKPDFGDDLSVKDKAAIAAYKLQRGGEKASAAINNAVNKAPGAIKKMATKAQKAGEKAVDKLNKATSSANLPSKAPANLPSSDITPSKPDSARKAAIDIKKAGKYMGATVALAAILYGGYKTFKRFFSKAARACANKSGAEKTACMQKFRKNAIKAQINDLNRAKSACKSTKNPQKCQASIQAKIEKLQSKAA